MKSISSIILLPFLLCGCSSHWIKNRATAEDFLTAKTFCEAQAENKFPVKNEVAQKTIYSKKYEKCKKNDDCEGKKYKTTERPETQSYVMDVNDDSRRRSFYQCMSIKGWEKETKFM
ncbi:hypothetical protein LU631_21270 [Erwinia tracheiphila]|uniref:Lipoprotein n=1 Tax=Erwinia tracheiphila TaxID=65700 RepID=A0A0M2KAJ5_9GAMM|nr:hypothetical protein [Erwinia tracheiphila]AXF77062.1 hypothetical protein AV903_15210 [Erwinia tracheiphila]EOS93853.1 hypothetical protein ETR_16932 [Erwinia tracheiphila PSU-1]KKF35934.1 hypothetical protein SY86_11680 [Erwinia tracheiphila]UIA84251.1 hypothetical protein LU604_04135 [Erwinia tracheiphila]UIA87247.1 hypothetical protein LU631_21270 [Erwinia tracheiphila]